VYRTVAIGKGPSGVVVKDGLERWFIIRSRADGLHCHMSRQQDRSNTDVLRSLDGH